MIEKKLKIVNLSDFNQINWEQILYNEENNVNFSINIHSYWQSLIVYQLPRYPLTYLVNLSDNLSDNLFGKFLKDDADILARPISQLCNLSIKLNSFPRSCEVAKVKLLFKKGSKTDPQKYRPISLLPILSKIIERVIHDQTQELLSQKQNSLQISTLVSEI